MARFAANWTATINIGKVAMVTAAPMTLACFYLPSSLSADACPITVENTINDLFDLQIPAADKRVYAETGAGGVYADASDGLSATSTGQWYFCGAVFTAVNSRQAWRGTNGTLVGGTVNTTSLTPATPTTAWIGGSFTGGSINGCRGTIAWVGIWAAALVQAELQSLALGRHPRRVRPQSIVAALNLTENPAVDLVGSPWTVTSGLTEAVNPPIYM